MSDFSGRMAVKQSTYHSAEDDIRAAVKLPVLALLAYTAWVVILV